MAQGKKKSIEQYDDAGKARKNNPSAGLVKSDSEYDGALKVSGCDPHLDPTMQWAGKTGTKPSSLRE